ncbi:MAG TPA: hypothetical protein VJL29_04450 [Thermoguttaceae bacterium]|nr:hypothetical protein [Thermoguttaceae bacterium]
MNSQPGQPADAFLARSVVLLEGYHSIGANVEYEAELFGVQLTGRGTYRELRAGPVPRVRLELEVPLENRMGALVEICDGRQLWTYRRLFDEEKLTRVDLERVARAITQSEESPPLTPMTGTIGMGGLAGLMKELQRNFRFEIVGPSQWRDQPTWELRGRWLPERLARVLPDQKDAILRGETPDYRKLPPHLPSLVLLTLGRENLFPYRVEYRRPRAVVESNRSDAATPDETEGVEVKWLGISLDEPMNPEDFECRPGTMEVTDLTESHIERLKGRMAPSPTEPQP